VISKYVFRPHFEFRFYKHSLGAFIRYMFASRLSCFFVIWLIMAIDISVVIAIRITLCKDIVTRQFNATVFYNIMYKSILIFAHVFQVRRRARWDSGTISLGLWSARTHVVTRTRFPANSSITLRNCVTKINTTGVSIVTLRSI